MSIALRFGSPRPLGEGQACPEPCRRGEGSTNSSAASVKQLPAVIVCPGYLANLAFVEIPWAADLTRLGFAALFLDRRGHGMSGGALWPTPASDKGLDDLEPDVAKAVAYLRSQHGLIDPARIALLGHSDGATAAITAAAADWDVRATVAVSASVAPAEFVNHIAPQNLLLVYGAEDHFVLKQTDSALIAHGTRGYLAAPGRFGDLASGSARQLVRVPGCGHLDVFYSDAARSHILEWLRQSLESPVRQAALGKLALSPHRAVWLISGAAAMMLALIWPFDRSFAGRLPHVRPAWTASHRRKGTAAPSRERNKAVVRGLLALPLLWAAGLLLSPWLARHSQTVVPGQEGSVLASLLVGPAVILTISGILRVLACTVRASARQTAVGPKSSGGCRLAHSYFPVQQSRRDLSETIRAILRGSIASALLFGAAHFLLLHHYEIRLDAARWALFLIFAGMAVPTFSALELWLKWLLGERPLYAAGCIAVLAGTTAFLSGHLFERMSIAPGYLLAASLLASAAYRIGDPDRSPVGPAVLGALTISWMGAVGVALY